jgi:CubicO group peptidase (beta-lactamase class C family)
MKIIPLIAGLVLGLLISIVAQAKPVNHVNAAPVTQEMQQIVSLYSLDGASLQLFRDGNSIQREYHGNFSPSTRVWIGSATKWLSALALARLVDKKQMSWEDRIGLYIPNAPVDKKDIRLRQLFSHTSGMSKDENDCISNAAYTLTTCTEQILLMPLSHAPGTTFAYGGNSMSVAGRMAEIATGKTWDQIFIDEMAAPLGLTNTDYTYRSASAGYVRNTNPRIAGGIRTTMQDYSIVLAMLQNNGMHQGQRFISSTTLDYMAIDQTAGTTIAYTPYPESFGYGIGQWREAVDFNGVAVRVSSPGAFGVTPWLDKRNRIAGIFFVKDQWSRLRLEIFDLQHLISIVYSKTYSLPPQKPSNVNRKTPGAKQNTDKR